MNFLSQLVDRATRNRQQVFLGGGTSPWPAMDGGSNAKE